LNQCLAICTSKRIYNTSVVVLQQSRWRTPVSASSRTQATVNGGAAVGSPMAESLDVSTPHSSQIGSSPPFMQADRH
jgi:hypothetical protein